MKGLSIALISMVTTFAAATSIAQTQDGVTQGQGTSSVQAAPKTLADNQALFAEYPKFQQLRSDYLTERRLRMDREYIAYKISQTGIDELPVASR